MSVRLRNLLRSMIPKARPLAFKRAALERRFEEYRLSTSLVPARLALFTAAALYLLYGAMDVQLERPATLLAWAVRCGVAAATVAVLVRSYQPLSYAYFQRLLTGLSALGGVGVIAMLASAPPPSDQLYFGGLLLAVTYVFVMLRLRLTNAFGLACLYLAGYCAVAAWLVPTAGLVLANRAAIFMGFVITGVVAGYSLEYHERRAFLRTQSARRRMTELAGILADVDQQRRDAEESSRRDPLTDMYNRRHFCAAARRELTRHERTSLAMIMVDIDHFKAVNDTYGHAVGDQALRAVARIIDDHTRPMDVACRYGGEEFAILLTDTDIDAARAVGRRLHARIRNALIRVEGVELSISASVGVAAVRAIEAPDLDDLLRRADHALYLAKQEGRDQVRTWNLDASARLAAKSER